MNSLEEKLSRLNNQYQDKVQKCNSVYDELVRENNKKYDELVREYRINKPKENTSFGCALGAGLYVALYTGLYAFLGTCTISCITNCDDWWNCDLGTVWMDSWFRLHVIIPTVIIMSIVYLISLIFVLIDNNLYKRAENSINRLECERKKVLDKLQIDYDVDRQQIDVQHNKSKQQIIVQYNQNREKYIKQLRNSNNISKLVKQVFVDFERAYEMIDKSEHIKEIRFTCYFNVNREDIRISAIKGQSRLHDMGYIYERMQMKNLENIEHCEAVAVVLSEEVDFMIKEHHKQAKTVVKCDGTIVQIEFDEVNMNYKGLEAW